MRKFCKVLLLFFSGVLVSGELELAATTAEVDTGGGEIRLNLLAKLSRENTERHQPRIIIIMENLNEHNRSAASQSHARIQRTGVGADLAASQDSNHRNYRKRKQDENE